MDLIFKQLALVGDVWVLWILLASSVLSLSVVFERWLSFRKNKVNFPLLLAELQDRLAEGNWVSARRSCEQMHSVEGRVCLAGLKRDTANPAALEQAMLSQLTIERNKMEENLVILGTLGNNAPFIGLFGTVLGIIKAFNDLAVTGSSGVSVVMAGISAALVATAFGILVAIPAVVANNYFHTRIRRVAANAQALIHLLQSYCHERQDLSGSPSRNLHPFARVN